MKKILLISLLTTFSILTKGQNFIDTSKAWNVYSCVGAFLNSCTTITYKFKTDTIINTKKYYKLFATYDSIPTNWWAVGLFTEDTLTKKVYWYENNQDELLYDFNLSVGDTAKVVSFNGNTFCPYYMIVDSIKFNTYYGVTRKQWYFNTPFFYGAETWIAGIGNLFGPADNMSFICVTDYGPLLICYKEGANQKYMDPNFTVCYKTTVGIKENSIEANSIILLPNPTQGTFSLQTNNTSNKIITIKNELGQIITQTTTSDKNVSFDLRLTGMFFVTVTQDSKTWTGKLVKQ